MHTMPSSVVLYVASAKVVGDHNHVLKARTKVSGIHLHEFSIGLKVPVNFFP